MNCIAAFRQKGNQEEKKAYDCGVVAVWCCNDVAWFDILHYTLVTFFPQNISKHLEFYMGHKVFLRKEICWLGPEGRFGSCNTHQNPIGTMKRPVEHCSNTEFPLHHQDFRRTKLYIRYCKHFAQSYS